MPLLSSQGAWCSTGRSVPRGLVSPLNRPALTSPACKTARPTPRINVPRPPPAPVGVCCALQCPSHDSFLTPRHLRIPATQTAANLKGCGKRMQTQRTCESCLFKGFYSTQGFLSKEMTLNQQTRALHQNRRSIMPTQPLEELSNPKGLLLSKVVLPGGRGGSRQVPHMMECGWTVNSYKAGIYLLLLSVRAAWFSPGNQRLAA